VGVVRALSHPGDDLAEDRAAAFEVVGAVPPLAERSPILVRTQGSLYSERVGDLGVRIACSRTVGFHAQDRAAPDVCTIEAAGQPRIKDGGDWSVRNPLFRMDRPIEMRLDTTTDVMVATQDGALVGAPRRGAKPRRAVLADLGPLMAPSLG